jgi:hypothetical protein
MIHKRTEAVPEIVSTKPHKEIYEAGYEIKVKNSLKFELIAESKHYYC